MRQHLMSISDAGAAISAGGKLIIAGDEDALRRLPKGDWIGGTIPYFITSEVGGAVIRDKVFVTDITGTVTSVSVTRHDQDSLAKVYSQGPRHGFSFVIIPASCKTHLSFALNAPNYKDFGVTPLIGWISGVHLDDLGKKTPKVFNGQTGEAIEEGAVVLRAELPESRIAEIGIVNLFQQGGGDTLTFMQDGFSASEVMVNGEKRDFAAYILENKFDTRLPLVADYYGVQVNISFQSVDAKAGVHFYAPVFSGIRYKLAKPVPDYLKSFNQLLKQEGSAHKGNIAFSCNCILNYLYSELEGKKTEPFSGPATFGEIAYQLLNQTLVYLEIKDI
ncbi:hypothetical protein dsx2_1682 [Desulfovibrio sp. X2]|uniref:DUF6976 family protein n=1 Tax=Desulfovibrio sp. X2 TaxID=941449 RepID=UPI000358C590|nr:hypothetical protein [Desulfovibrio sp. X2]EPR44321.1 hypothetical protein dsx2_1682 [Desulfovibrio sp. X2]